MTPGSPVGPPACEGYQAVATDGCYLHVARIHCPGCADMAALREQLAKANESFQATFDLGMAVDDDRRALRERVVVNTPTPPDPGGSVHVLPWGGRRSRRALCSVRWAGSTQRRNWPAFASASRRLRGCGGNDRRSAGGHGSRPARRRGRACAAQGGQVGCSQQAYSPAKSTAQVRAGTGRGLSTVTATACSTRTVGSHGRIGLPTKCPRCNSNDTEPLQELRAHSPGPVPVPRMSEVVRSRQSGRCRRYRRGVSGMRDAWLRNVARRWRRRLAVLGLRGGGRGVVGAQARGSLRPAGLPWLRRLVPNGVPMTKPRKRKPGRPRGTTRGGLRVVTSAINDARYVELQAAAEAT